jgi:hypothetical protein
MRETIVREQKMALEYSEAVIDKIGERGWNVYEAPRPTSGSLDFIKAGPATCLEVGKHYAMLPVVVYSDNPAQVALAFTALVKRLDWNMPTMETHIGPICARFYCGKDKIYPNVVEGGTTEFSPSEYIKLLETLPALTSPKVQQEIKNAIRKV